TYRDPNDGAESGKSMLGTKQIEWLSNLMHQTSVDDHTKLVVFCSEQQINMNASIPDEHWGRYMEERDMLGNILATSGVPVVVLTGDEHRSGFKRSLHLGNGEVVVLQFAPIEAGDPIAVFGPTAHRGRHVWDWGSQHHKGFGQVDISDTDNELSLRFRVNA